MSPDSVWMARKGRGDGQWTDWWPVGCDEAERLSRMLFAYEVKRYECVEYRRDANARSVQHDESAVVHGEKP